MQVSSNDLKEFFVKYYKTLSYFELDNRIVIVDKTFKDMFTTAYVSIDGLPEMFIGHLDNYIICVFLLYRQLQWHYDECDRELAKFRKDIFEAILGLNSRQLMPLNY